MWPTHEFLEVWWLMLRRTKVMVPVYPHFWLLTNQLNQKAQIPIFCLWNQNSFWKNSTKIKEKLLWRFNFLLSRWERVYWSRNSSAFFQTTSPWQTWTSPDLHHIFLTASYNFFFFFYLNFYEIKDVIKFHVFEMGIWSTNRGRTGTRLFLFPFPMPSTFSSVAKFGVKTSMSPGERRMRCFVVYAKY